LAEDRLSVRNEGTGVGQIGLSGVNVTYGGATIGTLSGGVGATLTVALNGDATAAAVDALIENLTYGNVSDAPTADRTLRLNVFDAAGADIAPLAGVTTSYTPLTSAANPFAGNTGYFTTVAFADLDGDGDDDAIVGDFAGTLRVLRNGTATQAGAFVELTGAANPLSSVDVGNFSTPAFADLDGDGDLDAVVGEQAGILTTFRNGTTGTTGAFVQLSGSANPLAGVVVAAGWSTPGFVDLDGDGDLDAVVGDVNGGLRAFRSNAETGSRTFTELTGASNPFTGVDVGKTSSSASPTSTETVTRTGSSANSAAP
jgi:hypothetical protein